MAGDRFRGEGRVDGFGVLAGAVCWDYWRWHECFGWFFGGTTRNRERKRLSPYYSITRDIRGWKQRMNLRRRDNKLEKKKSKVEKKCLFLGLGSPGIKSKRKSNVMIMSLLP